MWEEIRCMGPLLMHLFLSAYVAPLIGTLMVLLSEGSLLSVWFAFPFIAPLLTWNLFVPLGCCSFWFFRRCAVASPKGWKFWAVSWSVIGTISGVLAGMSFAPLSRFWHFVVIGILTGLVFSQFHRSAWTWMYPICTPDLPVDNVSESKRGDATVGGR